MPPQSGVMKCGTFCIFGLSVILGIFGISIFAYGIASAILLAQFDALFKTSTGTVSAVQIVSGFLLLIISYFGCYAVMFENRRLILIYSGVMAFIVLLRLVTIVMSLGSISKEEETEMKQNLNDSMKEYHINEKIKFSWDFFHKAVMEPSSVIGNMKCCGVNNYTDWGENIPKSCCKEKLKKDEKCPTGKYFKEGCWETSKEDFRHLTKGISVWNIVGFLLQIVAVVLACLLVLKMKQVPPKPTPVAGEQQENQQHFHQGEIMHSGISSV